MKRIILKQGQIAPSAGITSIPEFPERGVQSRRIIQGTVWAGQAQSVQSTFHLKSIVRKGIPDGPSRPAKFQRACQPGTPPTSAPARQVARPLPAFQPGTQATRILLAQSAWAWCKEDKQKDPEKPGEVPGAVPTILRMPSQAPEAGEASKKPAASEPKLQKRLAQSEQLKVIKLEHRRKRQKKPKFGTNAERVE